MLDSSGHPYLPRGAATGGNGSEEGMKHWKTLLSALLVVLLAACGTAALPGEPGGPDGEDDPKGPGKDPTNPGGPTNPVTSTRFFLFSGDDVRNTTNPTVAVDAFGGVHVVFPAYAVEDAFYAYCPEVCASQDDFSVVTLDTVGTVNNAMLAVDGHGRPRVLLSTYLRVYYASCDADCGEQGSWQVDVILEHGGDYEVSGEAFALDPFGRPRFLMHTYRTPFPTGDWTPSTHFVMCNAFCDEPERWESWKVDSRNWEETTLRFSEDGTAHVATAVLAENGSGHMLVYFACDYACEEEGSWVGLGFVEAYSDPYVSLMYPAIALELTDSGAPRVALIGEDYRYDNAPMLVYLECDADCTEEEWSGSVLIAGDASEDLGPGIDLALDAKGAPRIAYTAASSVLMAHCDVSCAGAEASGWDLNAVEFAGDIPADQVIPYHNCTVAAWLLREPSLAIGAGGLPLAVYRAEDVSAPGGPQDPRYPPCRAGADMTLTRFARLGGY